MITFSKTITNRIDWIDSLRGFAILLVIIGHLIQFNYYTSIENDIFNVIYSFHMPLFFFISGVCASYSKEIKNFDELWKYGLKKFLQLIVPSITWTILIPLFFAKDLEILLKTDSISSFWFLNVLFAVYIIWGIYLYMEYKIPNRKYVIIGTFILWCIFFVIDFKRISLMYFALFAFGYFYHSTQISILKNKYLPSTLIVVFLLCCGMFEYGTNIISQANRIWMEFPLSVIASILLAEFFKSINKGKLYNILNYIGKYTLGIYLCHFIFIHIKGLHYIETTTDKLSQFIILFAISILIAFGCILIQKIIEPFTLLYRCMYGKWNLPSILLGK